jgi:hypothetical protein
MFLCAEYQRFRLHDLHRTILRLNGFDHNRLSGRHKGRDLRLTENDGHIVKGIIA